jgi:hypothetical protein
MVQKERDFVFDRAGTYNPGVSNRYLHRPIRMFRVIQIDAYLAHCIMVAAACSHQKYPRFILKWRPNSTSDGDRMERFQEIRQFRARGG